MLLLLYFFFFFLLRLVVVEFVELYLCESLFLLFTHNLKLVDRAILVNTNVVPTIIEKRLWYPQFQISNFDAPIMYQKHFMFCTSTKHIQYIYHYHHQLRYCSQLLSLLSSTKHYRNNRRLKNYFINEVKTS